MKDLINLDNIGNPEVLENITNWSEIKNHVKIRNEKGDDGKMYIYLDPQLEDLTVEYDGNVHSLEVKNLPEGFTATYSQKDLNKFYGIYRK